MRLRPGSAPELAEEHTLYLDLRGRCAVMGKRGRTNDQEGELRKGRDGETLPKYISDYNLAPFFIRRNKHFVDSIPLNSSVSLCVV